MDDHEIGRKLRLYADAMGQPSRTVERRRAPRLWLGWVAACLVVGIAAFSLWPGDATAETLQRIQGKLGDVQSMRIRSYTKKGADAQMNLYLTTEYREGVWRHVLPERFKNVEFLRRGDLLYVNYHVLDHATVQAVSASTDFDDPALSEETTVPALEYVKRYVEHGQSDQEVDVLVKDGPEVRGRPTYALEFAARTDDRRKTTLVVDRASNLPLYADTVQLLPASRVLGAQGDHAQEFRSHHDFEFNVAISEKSMEPRFGKPIVNVGELRLTLREEWNRPIAAVGETRVLDACIGPEGTLWITYSVPMGQSQGLLPEPPQGFAPLPELASQGGAKILPGRQVLVAGFAPLDGRPRRGGEWTIPFAERAPRSGLGEERGRPTETDASRLRQVVLRVRSEGRPYPLFFAALGLDYDCVKVPMMAASARAVYLENRDRFEEAGDWWRAAGVAAGRWVVFGGHPMMREAEQCYRKAGMEKEAVAMAAEAKRLQRLR